MFLQHAFAADATGWGATFDALADCAHLCVKIIGRDGRILAINGPGLVLIGRACDETVCGTAWVDLWHGEDRQTVAAALDAAFDGTPSCHQLASLGGWDVEIIPYRATNGDIDAVLAVSRPVEIAVRAGAAREDLDTGHALHDIGNLVNVVASLSRLMRRGLSDDAAETFVADLDRIAAKSADALERLKAALRSGSV